MTDMLSTGSVIGILGGGQLGRMLSVAAARIGFKTAILEPGGDCPASHVANFHMQAEYTDTEALKRFAESVDVITYEFENIPTEALDVLEAIRPVRPGRKALKVSQDRLTEKNFLAALGLSVAPFAAVDDAQDLSEAIDEVGCPAILKTRRFGYDGKGQVRLSSSKDAKDALADMSGAPAILEGFVDFDYEVSVIGARNMAGDFAAFTPGENLHNAGILDTTTVPSRLSPDAQDEAMRIARTIMDKLDYVGVMGVELFVHSEGFIVNEIAPRVHNSGHWTQNGCAIDQFEQHIRAVAGWPIGDGRRHLNVTMTNLIGADTELVPDLAADPDNALHLYGKADVKPGRKMGHVNRITGPAT